MATDYSKLGSQQLTAILINEFKAAEGTFESATHKFYTVRKRMAKTTQCEKFMEIAPGSFFQALKAQKVADDLQAQSIKRRSESAKRRHYAEQQRYRNYDGDFDDMGNAAQADAYFYGNKKRRNGVF